jgi:hypothetical protein
VYQFLGSVFSPAQANIAEYNEYGSCQHYTGINGNLSGYSCCTKECCVAKDRKQYKICKDNAVPKKFIVFHTSYLLKEPILFSFWRSPFHGYTITQPFSFVKFKESKCHIGIFDNEKGEK